MTRHSSIVLAVAVGCILAATLASAEPRARISLNDGWRYADGPVSGAEAMGFDDAGWQAITVPHTWNTVDALDKTQGYRRGEGWYRRRFVLPPALTGRRLFLHFEGANQTADVWVDGTHIGRHVGGYTAFAFDVTPHVRDGRPVVLAVRVDNAHDPDVPPLNADFTFYGGIYRDVWLVATDSVHFDVLDHAGPGIYVDTPAAATDAATVRVRGRLVNDGASDAVVEAVTRVLDAEGREVAAVTQPLTVVPSEAGAFAAQARIERPRLWSPDDPYRYRVVVEVRTGGGTVLDRVEQPLGVRWIEVDPSRGFLLNGRPYPLTGTNRHQDFPGLGNALTDDYHRRDVRLVKETGFRFLRLAHYPQDTAVLDEADRIGLALWEEIPVVNRITPSAAFAANAERMLIEMIRQHYNHPSVVLWGWMNEPQLQKPDPMPDRYSEALVALAKRLNEVAHREDPFRPTAAAISYPELTAGSGVVDVPDVLGLNLYFGWYDRSTKELGPFLDELHASRPGRPLLISEYGAGHDERVHAANPVAFDFSTDHAQRFHRETVPQLRARPWLVGTAVWNQFDFGSDHRQDTKNALNQKGLFYFDRTPKDIAFYYRAILTERPVLHLEREGMRRAGSRPADQTQTLLVYTNRAEVELLHDGASLGKRRVANATAEWAVPLHDGANHFAARSDDGTVDAVEIHYADRTGLFARGVGEIAVNAGGAYSVVDAAGTVWEADRPYENGSWGYTSGDPARTHHRMLGTSDDPLFQASRTGTVRYQFDVPDGTYTVTLGWAETEHDARGARVFNVSANGGALWTGLDLAAEAGRWTATTRTADVIVTGGSGLTLLLEPTTGTAAVALIRLRDR